MDFITERIAIGTYLEGVDGALLSGARITGLLCLEGNRASVEPPSGIEKVNAPILDGDGNRAEDIERALAGLTRLLTSHERVLVHCYGGKSRSCLVVAAWMARTEGISFKDAVARVGARRSAMWLTPTLAKQVEDVVSGGSEHPG